VRQLLSLPRRFIIEPFVSVHQLSQRALLYHIQPCV
jgi:hypothetical protein